MGWLEPVCDMTAFDEINYSAKNVTVDMNFPGQAYAANFPDEI